MAAKRQIERIEKPPLMCATAGCPNDARVRTRRNRAERVSGKPNPVHVPFGPWLNLCWACDDRRHLQEAREYCELMGLDTFAKQKAWCLNEFKRGKNMLVPTLREPGQDEEFSYASQA